MAQDVRTDFVQLLLEKIENDPFPSTTMMDTVEELLTPDEVPAYAEVIMEKIREVDFPSPSLIDRLQNLF
jgi:hypothetical protein